MVLASDSRSRIGVEAGDAPHAGLPVRADGMPVPWPQRTPAVRLSAWPAHVAAVIPAALELEQARGTPFLLLPVCLGAGAATYFALPVEPGWPLLSGLMLAVVVLRLALAARRHLAFLCTALLVVCLGLAAGKIEAWRAGTAMLGSSVSTVLTGRVVAVEHQASGRTRLTVDVEATRRPLLRYAPDRIRASARNDPGVAAGDRIEGVVRLFPPSGPVRPHGYDFAFESYMAGIGATGFFLGDPRRIEAAPDNNVRRQWAARVANMREAIAARIRRHLDGAAGEIAAALIAGVRAGIPEETNEALRKAGLAHVLSISGLHMALVAGTVMLALRALFAALPGFSSRHPVKKYAAAAALVAASYYLLVSGAAVAAQRSFIMIAVMLVALLFDRAAITMRNLAIAALIIIAIAPHEVVGPSFQMSFAATAALIAAYATWAERASAAPRRDWSPDAGLARRLASRAAYYTTGLAMTSLIAGGATTLFAVWHFHRAAPLGLIANLAAMPVVSLIIMPFAVIAGVLMPLGLEGPALRVMGQGISAMVAIADWVAGRTPFDAVGALSPAALLWLTAALIVATIATTRLRWIAVPLAVAGLAALLAGRHPDLLVSEDGKLLALARSDGGLAVSRSRPNGFTVGIWEKSLASERLVKPETSRDAETSPLPGAADGSGEAFVCAADTCVARHSGGAVIVQAATAEAAAPFCAIAAIIIIEDATAKAPCGDSKVLVVTARDLARRGSLAVHFDAGTNQARAQFAISEPFRPWHDHRRFSREARGLPPYRRSED